MSSNENLEPAVLDSDREYPASMFLHPELSLLAFHERVLNMALREDVPLLEKLKFLCIFSSNLDEFFEIRVSGLKAKETINVGSETPDGMGPTSVLEAISAQVHKLVKLQYDTLNTVVLKQMSEQGIKFSLIRDWNPAQRKWLKQYFKREVLPILTAIRLDSTHPFPLTINKGLSIVVDLHDPDRDEAHNIAVVPAPRALPRFVRLPEELCDSEYEYVYLSSIIHANIDRLFANIEVKGCYQFRITRNSDLYVDLEEVEDLARTLQGELPSRLYGDAVRLEVSQNCPKRIIKVLQDRFQLSEEYIYQVDGPVNLNRLIALPDLVNRPELKYKGFTPAIPSEAIHQPNIFDLVSKNDLLLHHPFQSFAPVVDFLKQAASDPDVLAIKQTLYRTGSESILVEHLASAARSGKEVTAIIELMARFDEQNNLTTAERLQAAGAHVVYGMVGKKTHAKMLMVVRRESGKLKRYVHLGTGNYHQGNTKVYTDYGLITADSYVTQDVHEIFMQLTTQGPNPNLERLYQSPVGISDMVIEKLNREVQNALAGKPARVIAKVNGLSSPSIVKALYRASEAGVKIDLIVRGICCLVPGVEGVSHNIRVVSVVGRFLEHERVFYFENNAEKPELFLSSADLMPRNLRNRIEQCTPIGDDELKEKILSELEHYLNDTVDAWDLLPDGSYLRRVADEHATVSVQNDLLDRYTKSA